MSRSRQSVALIGLILLAGRPGAAEPDGGRVDRHGDPLPAGALMRLGTIRFRHGAAITALAFSPDGKQLTSAGHTRLRVWDYQSGRALLSMASASGKLFYSPNGKHLVRVAVLDVLDDLHIWEAASGKTVEAPGLGFPILDLSYSPDGTKFACACLDGQFRIVAADTGKQLAEITVRRRGLIALLQRWLDGGLLNERSLVAYAPNGKAVAAFADATLVLFDPATGRMQQRWDAPDLQLRHLWYSPDGKMIASIDDATQNVVLWDSATGNTRTIAAGPDDFRGGLAFTPDSKRLAILHNRHCQVYDTVNLKRAWQSPMAGFEALAFAPDGRALAAAGPSGIISMWETTRWTSLSPFGGHDGAVLESRLLDDGKTVVSLADDASVIRWDAGSGQELGRFRYPLADEALAAGVSAALSPDGKTLAVVQNALDANTGVLNAESLRFFDTLTGKLKQRSPLTGERLLSVCYSADGRLVCCGNTELAQVFNVATGKLLHHFHLFQDQEKDVEFPPRLGFSADSRQLIVATPKLQDRAQRERRELFEPRTLLQVFELTSGKLRRTLHKPETANYRHFGAAATGGVGESLLSVTPDGRAAILPRFDELVICDLRTGAELRRVGGNNLSALALSPDGRYLAAGQHDGRIAIWETASASVVARLNGHQCVVAALNFSADNRRLLSGGGDSAVLIWDLPALLERGQQARLSEQQLDGLWKELASDDAAQADRASLRLLDSPDQSVAYFQQKLQPVKLAIEPAAIDKLVADLDSEQFEVREQATKALLALEGAAALALKKAVNDDNLSLEARNRAQKLLDRLGGDSMTGDQLRLLRALEVLEQAATPEARKLLEALAGGSAAAQLTVEARQSLDRLRRLRP